MTASKGRIEKNKSGKTSKSPMEEKKKVSRPLSVLFEKLSGPGFTKYFWLILILFIIPVSWVKIYDGDVWWHMQLGKSMLENLGLPDYSKFYFTSFIEYYQPLRTTWLGDILLYAAHFVGGDIALQALRFSIVLSTCALLVCFGGRKFTGWHLLALLFLAVATYQKQLVRNSLVAMPFTTIVFWLWWRARHGEKPNILWFFPLLMGVWSCIHGSYLLGFGLMGLIFAGDLLDSLLRDDRKGKKLFLRYTLVSLLAFAAIAAWNPLTFRYLSVFGIESIVSSWEHQQPKPAEPIVEKPKGDPSAQLQAPGPSPWPTRLKKWLNQTLFPHGDSLLRSADFVSPFDKFDRLYVKISLAMGAAAWIILLLFIRPIRFSNILPFMAVTVFGLGYLRMVGYIPLAGVAIGFMCARNGEFTLHLEDKWPRIASVAILLAMGVNFFTGFKVRIGTELHEVGLGKSPVFSDKIARKIPEDFKGKPVFTTLLNGGFFLYRWYPEKKVFIDGFLPPHPKAMLDNYARLVIGEASPDEFHAKYGIEAAAVEQTKASLNQVFFHAENWYLRYMDEGILVHARQPDYDAPIAVPEILSSKRQIMGLAPLHRQRFTHYLYQIQEALIRKGRLHDTHLFIERNRDLIDALDPWARKDDKVKIREILQRYTQAYGKINSEIIQYDILHFEAVRTGDIEKAEKFGREVLKYNPAHPGILFNMVSAHIYKNEPENAKKYLLELQKARAGDKPFRQDQGQNIARLYATLFDRFRAKKEFQDAYDSLFRGHEVSASVISKEMLYDGGIELVREQTRLNMPGGALRTLKRMERDFPDHGRLLNEIAWHILTHEDQVPEGPETALDYAKRAVRLMEKTQSPLVDLAYGTLAEAYYRLDRIDKARHFLRKALKAAPEKRKKLFENRFEGESEQ